MPFKSKAERNRYDRDRYNKLKGRGTHPSAPERKVMFHARLLPSIVGRMQKLVVEGARHGYHPWQTVTEVCEDLLRRGFETLKDDETIADMLPFLETQRLGQEMSSQRREAQAMASMIKTETTELLSIKDREGAVAYFYTARQSVLKWTRTSWRDWLLREIDEAFPDLVGKQPQPVDLDYEPETDDEIDEDVAHARRRKGDRRRGSGSSKPKARHK